MLVLLLQMHLKGIPLMEELIPSIVLRVGNYYKLMRSNRDLQRMFFKYKTLIDYIFRVFFHNWNT